MTNDENTYIGMSLPEGIRYITVFEKGDFENCGRILRTFYRTEDRVRKLLALGNLLHLGGSLSSNENKTSCWPLNNGNPIHEAKEISGKEKFFLLGDWTPYTFPSGQRTFLCRNRRNGKTGIHSGNCQRMGYMEKPSQKSQ